MRIQFIAVALLALELVVRSVVVKADPEQPERERSSERTKRTVVPAGGNRR